MAYSVDEIEFTMCLMINMYEIKMIDILCSKNFFLFRIHSLIKFCKNLYYLFKDNV